MSSKTVLEEVAEFIVTNQVSATSLIRSKLNLNRADTARALMDLETIGVVGPVQATVAREIFVAHKDLEWVLARVRKFEAVNTK